MGAAWFLLILDLAVAPAPALNYRYFGSKIFLRFFTHRLSLEFLFLATFVLFLIR